MTKFYSKTTGGFYPLAMQADYVAAGSWPADAAQTTDGEEATIRAGLASGGTITGTSGAWVITPAAVIPLTSAQMIAANEVAMQAALDAMAQSRGYISIASACTYASSVAVIPSSDPTFATCEKFRLEGNALQSWMMRTWATGYAYLATVQANKNPMPTPAQAVSMMPVFTWPD